MEGNERARLWKQLFIAGWGLMIYAFSIETYVTGSQGLWRTLGIVAITVFFLVVAVIPLVRVLRARSRGERRGEDVRG